MLKSSDIRRVLDYDPATGIFIWRAKPGLTIGERRFNGSSAGKVAGTKRKCGYITIRIGTKPFLAHRLAWVHMHGVWPKHQMDHINGDRSDNRMCNLREATAGENHQNRGLQSNNVTGYPGVGWYTERRKWTAFIQTNGERKYLGIFTDKQSAAAAYDTAKATYHTFQPRFRDKQVEA